jgi:tRNA(adenine34) deaminase
MQHALTLARQAESEGEVPVGAVAVRDGEIIGRGWNRPIRENDPTAHAEMFALREAADHVGNYRLTDVDLYVTLEPCVMCAGAMVHARLRRLIYGAADPKTGAAGSVFDITASGKLNHTVEVNGGVLGEDCGDLLRAFFAKRR